MTSRAATTTLKLQNFEPQAKAWISSAQTLADQRGHSMLEPLHVLAQGLALTFLCHRVSPVCHRLSRNFRLISKQFYRVWQVCRIFDQKV